MPGMTTLPAVLLDRTKVSVENRMKCQ